MANQSSIKEWISKLAGRYAKELEKKMSSRLEEMKEDDKSHYLIYQVLGVAKEEGELIDLYQNKGRFLYKYAGAFLEEAAFSCFKEAFSQATKFRIGNTLGRRPKMFGVDCLIDKEAIEIKWRDATTAGDHIIKEHTRIQVIHAQGFKPIRLMFYYPNREQARKIQAALKAIYGGIGGEYYSGDESWIYLYERTKIDLKELLIEIAEARGK